MRILVFAAIGAVVLLGIACSANPPGGREVYCVVARYDPPGHWNESTIYAESADHKDGWVFFEGAQVDWPGDQHRNFGLLRVAFPDDEFLVVANACDTAQSATGRSTK